ncbi:hypothetical protein E2C01_089134 [Portunus trituberculatus]|uniref:Uncharacterized protein n=1 Tax=Portunus trituberculatus TaxID=210409 RepID=A0A5B7JNR3_PORTR|nr:hypothetical protein [Portunus trituberculatus]
MDEKLKSPGEKKRDRKKRKKITKARGERKKERKRQTETDTHTYRQQVTKITYRCVVTITNSGFNHPLRLMTTACVSVSFLRPRRLAGGGGGLRGEEKEEKEEEEEVEEVEVVKYLCVRSLVFCECVRVSVKRACVRSDSSSRRAPVGYRTTPLRAGQLIVYLSVARPPPPL